MFCQTHIEACSSINRWSNIQGVGDEDILLEDYNSEGEQEDEDDVSFSNISVFFVYHFQGWICNIIFI